MDLLVSDLSDRNVKGEVIAVFHGDATPLVLNDDAYNANRHVQTGHPVHTGNPYGKLITGLMDPGVQIELWAPPLWPITGEMRISFPG